MSETTATATATDQTQTGGTTQTQQTGGTQQTTDTKPAATTDTKPATTDTKPADTAKSPVSTTKPASLIGDAGKTQTTADGTKKDGDASDGKKDDANKDGKVDGEGKAVVPEKYEVKVPEGMTLDQVALEKFTPIAKELGLSNDQVQKLADFQAAQISEGQQAQAKAFNDFKDQSREATVTFYGNKLDAALPFVAKGRDQFADTEVMELLEASGLSNHKAFVQMFEKMGRSVSEHKLVDGKAATPDEKRSPGSVVYAKDKKT